MPREIGKTQILLGNTPIDFSLLDNGQKVVSEDYMEIFWKTLESSSQEEIEEFSMRVNDLLGLYK